MTNELKPLEPPYGADVEAILKGYPTQNGYLLSLFRTFANSVRFLGGFVPNHLDEASPLSLRDREIAILRVTHNRGCEYEWGVHVAAFSVVAGLDEEDVIATCAAGNSHWDGKEKRLVDAIDEICSQSTLTEATLKSFQDDWSVEQQLEIIAICGTYSTISFVANIARLPNEEFAPKFPV